MIELEQVRGRLEDLGIYQGAAALDACLERATREQPTYIGFLNDFLGQEIAQRKQRNFEVRTKLAHLPYRKTIDEFDFSFQPSIDERLMRELASMSFATRTENILFLGPPGVGKSHLSVAMAMEAIKHGLSVYFVTLSHLIEDLRKAHEENRLDKRLRVYTRPKLLLIDEVGYLPMDRLPANLFFQVISARYERGSIIMTSNKNFREWGELIGDSILATAILDRLLHHSHIVNIRGNSYRLREKMKSGAYGMPKSVGE
ncbi:IS21-like element helper ATPase IstB [Tumebacillus lipolyticus]|uniref:IS21-like element helper ATPase IstB n=1 Tax=Tumebacillus lipolyticus TaxID=1280370 RepID=A0ABW5A0Q7_9BACL